jgi:hypothetical protein
VSTNKKEKLTEREEKKKFFPFVFVAGETTLQTKTEEETIEERRRMRAFVFSYFFRC